MCGSVTVTGPPAAIWRWKVGMTLPRLPSTLPKRTAQKAAPSGARSSSSAPPSASSHPSRSRGAPPCRSRRTRIAASRPQPPLEHVSGAQHVGRDRLDDVRLEDRDVLVGRRVEHDIGLPACERVHHGLAIGDVDQDLLDLAVGEVVADASCRWVSSWSSMTRTSGPKPDTCRQISDPMDPPAPVTRTRRPSSAFLTAAKSVTTSRRPRRSSIRGSRADRTDGCGRNRSRCRRCPSGPGRSSSRSRRPRWPGHNARRSTSRGWEWPAAPAGSATSRSPRVCRRSIRRPDAHEREPVRALVVVDDGDREHAAAGLRDMPRMTARSSILAADHSHPDAHASVGPLPAEQARMEAQEPDAEHRQRAAERDHLSGTRVRWHPKPMG